MDAIPKTLTFKFCRNIKGQIRKGRVSVGVQLDGAANPTYKDGINDVKGVHRVLTTEWNQHKLNDLLKEKDYIFSIERVMATIRLSASYKALSVEQKVSQYFECFTVHCVTSRLLTGSVQNIHAYTTAWQDAFESAFGESLSKIRSSFNYYDWTSKKDNEGKKDNEQKNEDDEIEWEDYDECIDVVIDTANAVKERSIAMSKHINYVAMAVNRLKEDDAQNVYLFSDSEHEDSIKVFIESLKNSAQLLEMVQYSQGMMEYAMMLNKAERRYSDNLRMQILKLEKENSRLRALNGNDVDGLVDEMKDMDV